MVLDAAGDVFGFGSNSVGNLGVSAATTDGECAPIKIPGFSGSTARLYCGYVVLQPRHSCEGNTHTLTHVTTKQVG